MLEETKSETPNTLMLGFIHCFVGVGASMLIAFLTEAFLSQYWVNTRFEPFAPMIAATGLVLGLVFSVRVRNGQGASLAWIFGLAYFAIGFYGAATSWDPKWSAEKTRWAYAVASLFGPSSSCSGTECMGELLLTMPATASVTYSIGSFIRRHVLFDREKMAV